MPINPTWEETEDVGAEIPKFEDTMPVGATTPKLADELARGNMRLTLPPSEPDFVVDKATGARMMKAPVIEPQPTAPSTTGFSIKQNSGIGDVLARIPLPTPVKSVPILGPLIHNTPAPSTSARTIEQFSPDKLNNVLNTSLVDYLPKDIREGLAAGLTINHPELADKADLYIAGGAKGVGDVAKGFLSPVGLATLNMGGVAPAAQRVISLAFATQMASAMPEEARQIGEIMGQPPEQRDYQKLAQLLTAGAGNSFFAAQMGKHGLAAERPSLGARVEAMTPAQKREFAAKQLANALTGRPVEQLPEVSQPGTEAEAGFFAQRLQPASGVKAGAAPTVEAAPKFEETMPVTPAAAPAAAATPPPAENVIRTPDGAVDPVATQMARMTGKLPSTEKTTETGAAPAGEPDGLAVGEQTPPAPAPTAGVQSESNQTPPTIAEKAAANPTATPTMADLAAMVQEIKGNQLKPSETKPAEPAPVEPSPPAVATSPAAPVASELSAGKENAVQPVKPVMTTGESGARGSRPAGQSDFARYQQLTQKAAEGVKRGEFPPPEVQREIEAIKNRNDGMAPTEVSTEPAPAGDVKFRDDAALFDKLVRDFGPQNDWASGDEGVYDPSLDKSDGAGSAVTARIKKSEQMANIRRRAASDFLPPEERGDIESAQGRAKLLPRLIAHLQKIHPGDEYLAKTLALHEFSRKDESAPDPQRAQQDARILDRISGQNPNEPLLQAVRTVRTSADKLGQGMVPAEVRTGTRAPAVQGNAGGNRIRPSVLGAAGQRTIHELERIFGVRIIRVESKAGGPAPFNGWKDTKSNVLLLDAHAEKPLLVSAGHELGHHIELQNPQLYGQMADGVMNLIREYPKFFEAYRARMDRAGYRGRQLQDVNVHREIVNDFIGDCFKDPKFLQLLAAREPKIFKRFAKQAMFWLDKLIAKAKTLTGYGVDQHISDLEAARGIVADAVAKFSKEQVTGIREGDRAAAVEPAPADEFSRKARGDEGEDLFMARPERVDQPGAGATTPELALKLGNSPQVFKVPSLEAAAKMVDQLTHQHMIDGGDARSFPSTEVIDTKTGKPVAYISWNGRIWDGPLGNKNKKEIERMDGRGYGKPATLDVASSTSAEKKDFFSAPESVDQQKARVAGEKRHADATKAKAAMQDKAQARLTGADIDTTGDIFDTDRTSRVDKAGQGSLFSRKDEKPLWRSNIEDALPSWQNKGTPQQLLAHLAKTRGAMDEAEWIGLDDWLKGKTSVSKEDIQDFLDGNKVDVQEVTLGDGQINNQNELPESMRALVDEFQNGNTHQADFQQEARRLGYTAEFGMDGELESLSRGEPSKATKFEKYQLPGGENYRELLLTLPAKEGAELPPGYKAIYDQEKNTWKMQWPDGSVVGGWSSRDAAVRAQRHQPDQQVFRSSHFDEPNILAHVRMNERTDADGKRVLHLEEVQSDWHQKGRKHGYSEPPAKTIERFEEPALKLEKREYDWQGTSPDGRVSHVGRGVEATESGARSYLTRHLNKLAAEKNMGELQRQREQVPSAPFKQTWPMLAMKRMIRYASENGFDRLTWTTGEQQAARYDLSKQISRVVYSDGILNAYGLNGENVLRKPGIKDAEVEDYIGKDAAEKLLAKPGAHKEIAGLDLKVGGEGMKGFYDKILPAEVNKFVKKWGGKVGQTKIEVEFNAPEFHFDGDEPSVEAVSEKVKSYREPWDNPQHRSAEGWRNWNVTLDRMAAQLIQEMNRGATYVNAMVRVGGQDLTDKLGFGGLWDSATNIEQVHSLDITPAMTAAAMEGMPLFSRKESTDKNLVAIHNLSLEKLMHADKLGGLPVPSIAITRADKVPFTSYGEISLVGNPELITPSKDTKVLNADAYSPRYPTVHYFPDQKSVSAVQKLLTATLSKLPAEHQKNFSKWNLFNESPEKPMVKALKDSPEMMLAYLDATGRMPELTPAEDSRYQQQHDYSAVRDLVTYNATEKPKFEQWVDRQLQELGTNEVEKIYKGFTNAGNKSYLPHNLDNVVRIMKQGFRDAEGFNYGAGSVRATTAKQFRTLDQIKAARGSLTDEATIQKLKEETNDELAKLADESMAHRSSPISGFGRYDAFSDDLKAMAEGGAENFKYLREMYPGGEPFPAMRGFLEKLRNMPTDYFEAKARRAVQLQEFSGAVVPEGTAPEVIKSLERRGLTVKTYPKGDAEARRATVQALAADRDALFSRKDDGTATDRPERERSAAEIKTEFKQAESDLANATRRDTKTQTMAEYQQAKALAAARYRTLRDELLHHPEYVEELLAGQHAAVTEANAMLKPLGKVVHPEDFPNPSELRDQLTPDQFNRFRELQDTIERTHVELARIPKKLVARIYTEMQDAGKLPKAAPVRSDLGRSLDRLTDWLRTNGVDSPRKSLVDRLNLGRRFTDTVQNAKTSLQKAWITARAVGRAALESYKAPPKDDDFRHVIKSWIYADQRTGLATHQFVKELVARVPHADRRKAMSLWLDADGDMSLLKFQADTVPDAYRRPFELAMKLSAGEKALAMKIKEDFAAKLEDGIQAGLIERGREDYGVPQRWKIKPETEGDFTGDKKKGSPGKPNAKLDSRDPFFSFQRETPGYFEGIMSRGVPENLDIAHLVATYDAAFHKSLSSRGMIAALQEAKARDGLPVTKISGAAHAVPNGEGGKAYFVDSKAWNKSDVTTDGRPYRSLDHTALKGWKLAFKDESGNPIIVKGDMLIHPDHFDYLKNELGQSRLREGVAGKVLNPVFQSQAFLKASKLSGSLFHLFTIGEHMASHLQSPFLNGFKLDMRQPDQTLLVRNGLELGMSYPQMAYEEGLMSAHSGLLNKIPLLGDLSAKMTDWMFKDYIPAIMMKVGLKTLESNRKRYGDKLTPDQIAELTAMQMNAAGGLLNYRLRGADGNMWGKLGADKTWMDLQRMALMAPQFLEARARVLGQALKPYGHEQRKMLIIQAGLLYVGARILNQLLDEDPHWHDNPFSVVHNGRAYSIRTIVGDFYHLLTDPKSFAAGRLSPFARIGIESITGRDLRTGARKEPPIQTEFVPSRVAQNAVMDVINWLTPIPADGLLPGAAGKEQTAAGMLLSSIGVGNRKFTASMQIRDLAADFNRNSEDPATRDFQLKRDGSAWGNSDYRKLDALLDAGDLAGARQEYDGLLKDGKVPANIEGRYERQAPFTGNQKREAKFLESLTPKQRELYEKARAEQTARNQVFKAMLEK